MHVQSISHPGMEPSTVLQVRRRKHSLLGILFLALNFLSILYLITQSYVDKTKIDGLLNGEYKDTKVLDKIYSIYLEIHLPPSFCNVTIVTAYYRMSSKHSNEEYLSWMTNFLTLQDCMVIFTQEDFVSSIQILRPAYYQTIINSMELNQEYEDHHIISFTKLLIYRFYQKIEDMMID